MGVISAKELQDQEIADRCTGPGRCWDQVGKHDTVGNGGLERREQPLTLRQGGHLIATRFPRFANRRAGTRSNYCAGG